MAIVARTLRAGMPTLLLVRHAQASFGAADYDVLSERGAEQTTAFVADLERRGTGVARVVCGSLRRQRDTAAPIAMLAGCDLAVDPGWDEYAVEEIVRHHSASAASVEQAAGEGGAVLSSRAFQAYLDAALLDWVSADGGSAAAEPWSAFAGRVGAALDAAADGLGSGETGIVCTSAGVVAAVCVALLGVPPVAFVAFNRVGVNTGVTKVALGRGGRSLVSFNEHGHLDPRAGLVTYR